MLRWVGSWECVLVLHPGVEDCFLGRIRWVRGGWKWGRMRGWEVCWALRFRGGLRALEGCRVSDGRFSGAICVRLGSSGVAEERRREDLGGVRVECRGRAGPEGCRAGWVFVA